MAAVIGQHAPDRGVVEVDVEVGGDLPAVLDVEQGQGDVERLHLTKETEEEPTAEKRTSHSEEVGDVTR